MNETLIEEHTNGDHDTKYVEGCALCEEIRQIAAEEQS